MRLVKDLAKVNEIRHVGPTVKKRVQAEWSGWRRVARVMSDRKVSLQE